jgi:hypothetical protein
VIRALRSPVIIPTWVCLLLGVAAAIDIATDWSWWYIPSILVGAAGFRWFWAKEAL